MKLVRTELLTAILQCCFHRRQHAIKIKFVTAMVINLKVYVFPLISLHLVASRVDRKFIQNGSIRLVLKIMAAIFHPLIHQVARHNGSLVRRSTDCDVQVDLSIIECLIGGMCTRTLESRKTICNFESMAMPDIVIAEFDSLVIPNGREIRVLYKTAVFNNVGVGRIVWKSGQSIAN